MISLQYTQEIQSLSITVHNAIFSFQEIIEEIKRVFQFETMNKQLTFDVDEQAYPYLFHSDKKLILHALTTLLTNAFKYTTSGKISFVHYAEVFEKEKAKLFLKVEDTGIGMSGDTISDVFKVFSNAEVKKAENQASNGIGLYIVKRISSTLNGGITISSTLGSGSIMCV